MGGSEGVFVNEDIIRIKRTCSVHFPIAIIATWVIVGCIRLNMRAAVDEGADGKSEVDVYGDNNAVGLEGC